MLTSRDACLLVDVISRVTEIRQGIRPGFEEGDVLRALLEIAKVPRGRLWLAKNLRIGEASSRTLLRRLREMNLITVDRTAGAELTDRGKKLIAPLLVSVYVGEAEAPASLKDWGRTAVIVARNMASLLEAQGPLRLRDLAVECGVPAALIASYRDGRLIIPAVEDKLLYDELGRMLNNIKIKGDRLIIVLKGGLREAYRLLYRLLEAMCSQA